MIDKKPSVAVIGAGLAGSEAALVLARNNIDVTLFEMRPHSTTPAHRTENPAELVCSNSFKSDELPTAHGLLKKELEMLKSPIFSIAYENRIPAGSALAVDRKKFGKGVLHSLLNSENLTFKREEVTKQPEEFDYCIIAAGPLASDGLTEWMLKECSDSKSLHFYDSIAPVIATDSIDFSKAFYQSRWDKGTPDYCNCPFTEEEYKAFYDALIEADRSKPRSFEDEEYFEACLPVEVVANRGYKALTFGCMRPVGITNPHTGKRPYAVCQLRKETSAGVSFNMVGFQTRMRIKEQKKVLRMIPGLENAEFLRYGSIHRNTYLDSPRLLNKDLSFKKRPNLFLAGQLCGNEGYSESVATGHVAALAILHRIAGKEFNFLNNENALGALVDYVTDSDGKHFSPTNINFGLMAPPISPNKRKLGKSEKKELVCTRALQNMESWISENAVLLKI